MSMSHYTEKELKERAADCCGEWNPWQAELDSRERVQENAGADIFAPLSSPNHVASTDIRCGLVETAARVPRHVII